MGSITADRHCSSEHAAQLSENGSCLDSSKAIFEVLECPLHSGGYRSVTKGIDTNGQAAVAKWFWDRGVIYKDYFTLDIKAMDKALEIVDSFNHLDIELFNKIIKINFAEVQTFDAEHGEEFAGMKYLCEPYIEKFHKFNSNTGWNDDKSRWAQIMQALSHYSYHITNGKYVLCDLQGGISRHEIVLSNPAIMSQTREFGVTDLGPDGIKTFFSQHFCNAFCHKDWALPDDRRPFIKPVPGTTMMPHGAPTKLTKPCKALYNCGF